MIGCITINALLGIPIFVAFVAAVVFGNLWIRERREVRESHELLEDLYEENYELRQAEPFPADWTHSWRTNSGEDSATAVA